MQLTEDQKKMQLTEDQKKEVMVVMRQAECYDAKKAAQVYFDCGQDVLQAVCKLIDAPDTPVGRADPHRDAEQQHFDEMRTILKSKYAMYYELTNKSSAQDDVKK